MSQQLADDKKSAFRGRMGVVVNAVKVAAAKGARTPLRRPSKVLKIRNRLHFKGRARKFRRFRAETELDSATLVAGSGKTTLLMMIAGFLDPSSGSIVLDGRPITGLAPEKRNFGMVFQGYALFPHMTVHENIAYPLEVRKQARAAVNSRVGEMLELVQLGQFRDRLPRQLSGGQQQRVALARALSFRPVAGRTFRR